LVDDDKEEQVVVLLLLVERRRLGVDMLLLDMVDKPRTAAVFVAMV
jgi:hypothetical protein